MNGSVRGTDSELIDTVERWINEKRQVLTASGVNVMHRIFPEDGGMCYLRILR